MLILDRYGRRVERPTVPNDVDDAIKTFFRRADRVAAVEWHPILKCFLVRVERRVTDPVMQLVQSGKRSERQVMESIPLHEPVPGMAMTFKALDLEQMGPSGVTRWLEEHDLWSGRGRYKHPLDASREADRDQAKRQADRDAESDERAQEIVRRRMVENGLGSPTVGWSPTLERN